MKFFILTPPLEKKLLRRKEFKWFVKAEYRDWNTMKKIPRPENKAFLWGELYGEKYYAVMTGDKNDRSNNSQPRQ